MTEGEFNSYNLDCEILKAIDLLNYKTPTKVQKAVIPVVLQKRDVVVRSQTGSGKTASFAIPLCQLVDWEENSPQVLVVVPTRELAIQVREDIFNIGRFKRIKVCTLYGRSPFNKQQKELKQKTHMVVGTPGRIMDHLERGTFDTSKIAYLVIDEADEMLNMGFIDQVEEIIQKLPKDRLNILLSATMPKDIEKLCSKYINNPQYIEIEEESKVLERIIQDGYKIEQENKLKLLKNVTIIENPDSCIIFCNTKLQVDRIYSTLSREGYPCEKIHGGMEQSDRTKVMEDFKHGLFRYLVATDVASRGIDIQDVSLVINYDIPRDNESYVHRIGRTGRVDKKGKAVTFVTAGEEKALNGINEYIEKEIVFNEIPDGEALERCIPLFLEKINSHPEIKESKGWRLKEEIMKLHINAGKKTKMRASDIVGTICSIDGLNKEDIGVIEIWDVSTFVEILNDKGDVVLKTLKEKPIKGKIRKVKKV